MTKQYAWMTVKEWQPALEKGAQPEILLSQKSISQFCRDFNIAASALKADFGVIRITQPPDAPVHTFMIEPEAADKLAKQHPDYFEGPWQDYHIAPPPYEPKAPKPPKP